MVGGFGTSGCRLACWACLWLGTTLSGAAPGTVQPWGELETSVLYLDPPEELVESLEIPSVRPEWHFGSLDRLQVMEVFRMAGVSEEDLGVLQDEARWIQGKGQSRWYPPADFVYRLHPEVRAFLYRNLGQLEENQLMRFPFIFEDGDLEGRFAGTEFPEGIVPTIRGLSYPIGDSLAFSDLGLCLPLLENASEEVRLVKVLCRARTLVTRVKVGPGTDMSAAVDYWSGGGWNQGGRTMLEALGRSKTPVELDIAHLLPPIGRRKVHRFALLADGMSGRFPDALGAALDFYALDDQGLDFNSPDIDQWVRARFALAEQPNRFGDLILIVREHDRQAVHACVYLADDLVYVKNGVGVRHPWVISRLSSVMDLHRGGQRVQIAGWRRLQESN